MTQKLSFRASGTALVQDFDAMEHGIRRYIGRVAIDKDGKPTHDPGSVAGWKVKDEPQEVPYRAEYVKAAKDGDLVPADDATAAACGLKTAKGGDLVPSDDAAAASGGLKTAKDSKKGSE